MVNLYKLADYFNEKYGAPPDKPGMFGKLPLTPPGRKPQIDPEPKKVILEEPKEKIDPVNIKRYIMYVTELQYNKGHMAIKTIEHLEKINDNLSTISIKLAHKVEEVIEKGYQNTTHSEIELSELLEQYLKLSKAVNDIGENAKYYLEPSKDSIKQIDTIKENVLYIAKRK